MLRCLVECITTVARSRGSVSAGTTIPVLEEKINDFHDSSATWSRCSRSSGNSAQPREGLPNDLTVASQVHDCPDGPDLEKLLTEIEKNRIDKIFSFRNVIYGFLEVPRHCTCILEQVLEAALNSF